MANGGGGSDPGQAGALAALMQADPALAADVQQVQLDTSLQMAEAQQAGQLEQMRVSNQARIDLMKALVARRQRMEKAQQQAAGKQPPPGQAASTLVQGTMRGAGTEFPKIDTRKPMSQGRTDASGTGAQSGIMGTLAKLSAMGIGPGGAAARAVRGGSAAQSQGPVMGVRGPGGPAAAVSQAAGGPSPTPVPPQQPGMVGPGSVNIGGQQFSGPSHIVTTQRDRGYEMQMDPYGGMMPARRDVTRTTVEPNVLLARDIAMLNMEKQKAAVAGAIDMSRDTGMPMPAAGRAMQLALEGDWAGATQLTAPFPSGSYRLLEEQIKTQQYEQQYRNAMTDKALTENRILGHEARYIEAFMRLGPERFHAQDLAGAAGIKGLAPPYAGGVGGGLGGGGGGGIFGGIFSGGGAKGAITEGQSYNARRLNREGMFTYDEETGEATGLRNGGVNATLELGYSLRDDGMFWYFAGDDVNQMTFVPAEVIRRQIEEFQDPRTTPERWNELEKELDAYDSFLDYEVKQHPDTGAEIVEVVPVEDPAATSRGQAYAFGNLLQYWKEMPREHQVQPPPPPVAEPAPEAAPPAGPTPQARLPGTNIQFDPGAATRARFGLGPPGPADVAAAQRATEIGGAAAMNMPLIVPGAAAIAAGVRSGLASRLGRAALSRAGRGFRSVRGPVKPIPRPAAPPYRPGPGGPPRPPYFRPPPVGPTAPPRPGAQIPTPRRTTEGFDLRPPRPTGTPPWLSGSLESRAAAEARTAVLKRRLAALKKANEALAAKRKSK